MIGDGSSRPPARLRPSTPWEPTGRVDFALLSTPLRVVGAASFVLFLALEMPWYTIGAKFGTAALSGSANAMVAGGWRWVLWVVALALVVYVFLQSVTSWQDPVWLRRERVIIGAAGLDLLLVLLAMFVDKPRPPLSSLVAAAGGAVHTGWGAWLALVASIIALAAAVVDVGRYEPRPIPFRSPAGARGDEAQTASPVEPFTAEPFTAEPAAAPPGARPLGPDLPADPSETARRMPRQRPAVAGGDPPTGWMPPQPPPPPPL